MLSLLINLIGIGIPNGVKAGVVEASAGAVEASAGVVEGSVSVVKVTAGGSCNIGGGTLL